MKKTAVFALVLLFVVLATNPVFAAPQPIDGYGKSVANSTTAALGSGATFTGQWELVPQPDVMVLLKTDNPGTLFFDFSTDGINADSIFPADGFSVEANIAEFHTAVKGGRWFRVRLINDTGAQTFLRLGTNYGSFQMANATIGQSIRSDQDSIVVRSADPQVDMALGRLDGFRIGEKFGRNGDVDRASTPEDVWSFGGTYTGQPLDFTPETVTVVSSSTSDASAGVGGRTVMFFGLKSDTSTAYEFETVALNGTTPVTSIGTWWRVNRAKIITAGTEGHNVGVITIASSTTTENVFAAMPAELNQTNIAAYTVEAGHSIILKRPRLSITRSTGADGSALITQRVREPGTVYHGAKSYDIQTGDNVNYTAFGGDICPAGTDIKYTVESVSDDNTRVGVDIEYIVVKD